MHGTLWYGTVRYGTVRYGKVRYAMVRYGTLWYGTVRYASTCKWHGSARHATSTQLPQYINGQKIEIELYKIERKTIDLNRNTKINN